MLVKLDTNVFVACPDVSDDLGEIPRFFSGGISRFHPWNNSWVPCTNGMPTDIVALVSSGKHLIAATTLQGIFTSSDRGQSWKELPGSRDIQGIRQLALWDKDIIVCDYHTLWIRPLSEIITDARGESPAIPHRWSLEQNYPNPFNPATTISYNLPSKLFVTLKIYDLLGRDVATIVAEEQQAGKYSRQWHTSGYPSGVYFYRLQAGPYTETRRLVLLR